MQAETFHAAVNATGTAFTDMTSLMDLAGVPDEHPLSIQCARISEDLGIYVESAVLEELHDEIYGAGLDGPPEGPRPEMSQLSQLERTRASTESAVAHVRPLMSAMSVAAEEVDKQFDEYEQWLNAITTDDKLNQAAMRESGFPVVVIPNRDMRLWRTTDNVRFLTDAGVTRYASSDESVVLPEKYHGTRLMTQSTFLRVLNEATGMNSGDA